MLDGVVGQPADRIRFYREQGVYQDRTLAEMLDDGAARWGARPALIHGDETITYAELRDRVDRLALGLLALGCRPGDRMVVQLPNIPEFLYLYFACHRIGVLPVLALAPHRAGEIRYFLEHTGARYYAIPDQHRGFDYQALAAQMRQAVPGLAQVLVAGRDVWQAHVGLDALLATPVPAAPGAGAPRGAAPPAAAAAALAPYRPDPCGVALFLLSGGTTGRPKLIPRTHNDYWYTSLASGQVFGYDERTVSLIVVPMAHNFALACPGVQAVLLHGGTVVLSPGTDAETVFAQVERHRVTYVSAVPSLAIQWLHHPARHRFDLSSWQILQTGGQKFNPAPAALVRERLGCELHQGFGMGEGLLTYTRPGDDEYTRFHTVGRPLSPYDEVRVVDDAGRDVPPGTPGELWTRGPYTIRGYYRAAAHNRVAFTPDGFYKTGDVVLRDEEGRLVVLGRTKDLINRGGEKISAEEVENHLLAHPQVAAAAVVAMPDPVLGERACAYVVLREGSLDLAAVQAFLLARHIAKFKLPERLEVVPALPLTNVGKVDKQALRADIAARVAAVEPRRG